MGTTPLRHDHPIRHGAAHAAMAAGLGLALLMGTTARPITHAWAADGSLTITQQHNQGATYDAYCLFLAEISADDVATHISWSSPEMQTAVLAFLDAGGYGDWLTEHHPGDGQHDKAQNAAEFIAEQIAGSYTGEQVAGKPRSTAGASFANRLAQALVASSTITHDVARAGETFTGAEGYWLFVTTDATAEGDNEADTGPLWIPLGGSTTSISEKTAIPTVTKQVKEDASDTWGQVADAHVGQDLSYQLVATLPSNLASFESYHLCLTDTLSDGLSLSIPDGGTVADVLTVEVGGKEVPLATSPVTTNYHDNTLTIDIPDLLDAAWDGYDIEGLTQVTVTYQAHMNASCQTGASGNPNGVVLTYTNDPLTNGEGHTEDIPDHTKVFSYRIRVLKVDEQTNEPLPNVGFTVQVADDSSDVASRGCYVQEDGSLGTQAHQFVTDQDGVLEIVSIDEGSYLISEVDPPDGYEAIDEPLKLSVDAELDESSRSLTTLTADTSGTAASVAQMVSVTGFDNETGTVSLSVTNDRSLSMPLTGLDGVTGASLAGATLTLAALGVLLARKRHAL